MCDSGMLFSLTFAVKRDIVPQLRYGTGMQHNGQEIADGWRVFQPCPRDQIQPDRQAPPARESTDENSLPPGTWKKGHGTSLGQGLEDNEKARSVPNVEESGNRLIYTGYKIER